MSDEGGQREEGQGNQECDREVEGQEERRENRPEERPKEHWGLAGGGSSGSLSVHSGCVGERGEGHDSQGVPEESEEYEDLTSSLVFASRETETAPLVDKNRDKINRRKHRRKRQRSNSMTMNDPLGERLDRDIEAQESSDEDSEESSVRTSCPHFQCNLNLSIVRFCVTVCFVALILSFCLSQLLTGVEDEFLKNAYIGLIGVILGNLMPNMGSILKV